MKKKGKRKVQGVPQSQTAPDMAKVITHWHEFPWLAFGSFERCGRRCVFDFSRKPGTEPHPCRRCERGTKRSRAYARLRAGFTAPKKHSTVRSYGQNAFTLRSCMSSFGTPLVSKITVYRLALAHIPQRRRRIIAAQRLRRSPLPIPARRRQRRALPPLVDDAIIDSIVRDIISEMPRLPPPLPRCWTTISMSC